MRGQPTDLFAMLGVRPILGRTFDAKDTSSTNVPMVLSYSFWVQKFGGALES
jgi:hypothetical protein